MKKQIIIITALAMVLAVAGVASAGGLFGRRGIGPLGGRPGEMKGAGPVEEIAKAAGMTVEDLLKERQAGKSFAQILEAKGLNPETIMQSIGAQQKASMDERLKQLFEDTTIPPEPRLGRGPMPGMCGKAGRLIVGGVRPVEEIAKAAGMTAEDLLKERQTGKSFAQILQAKGQDSGALVTRLTAEAKAKLDRAVAAGKLQQDRADQMLARFADNLNKMLDNTNVPPARRGTTK